MSAWADLVDRKWTRKRWRKRTDGAEHCTSCEASFNRPDTYYVRPAYTDGEVWMCASCFDRMTEESGRRIDHRYGQRGRGPD